MSSTQVDGQTGRASPPAGTRRPAPRGAPPGVPRTLLPSDGVLGRHVARSATSAFTLLTSLGRRRNMARRTSRCSSTGSAAHCSLPRSTTPCVPRRLHPGVSAATLGAVLVRLRQHAEGRRDRPRPRRPRSWPGSGWRRTATGSAGCTTVYDEIPEVLDVLGVDHVDGAVLFDLGVSSMQLDLCASAASPTPRTNAIDNRDGQAPGSVAPTPCSTTGSPRLMYPTRCCAIADAGGGRARRKPRLRTTRSGVVSKVAKWRSKLFSNTSAERGRGNAIC